MSHTAQAILADALSLPTSDRGELISQLIESLDSHPDEDVDEAWSMEIERRLQQIDAGTVKMVPWSEARRLIRGSDEPASD